SSAASSPTGVAFIGRSRYHRAITGDPMRSIPLMWMSVLSLAVFASVSLRGQPQPWITRSNEYAQLLLKLQAKYSPESAGRLGVEGLDEAIMQLPANRREEMKKDSLAAIAQLEKWQADEKDPLVKQDLAIMLRAAKEARRGNELNEKYHLPYFN